MVTRAVDAQAHDVIPIVADATGEGEGIMCKVIAAIIGLDTAGQILHNPYLAVESLRDYWAWGCDMGWSIGMAGFQLGLIIIACFVAVPVLRGLWTIVKAMAEAAKEMTRYKI